MPSGPAIAAPSVHPGDTGPARPRAGHPPNPPGLAYNLAAMAVLAVLAALGAVYAFDYYFRNLRNPPPAQAMSAVISRTIAGRELHIPFTWFRNGAELGGGFTNQIDLRATFVIDGLGEPATIDVTLLPRSRVRPGSALLDTVYVHEFGAETLRGPPGLVGKPLKPSRGYGGETVWYDPLSPDPFVAKCMTPVEAGSAGKCLRSVVLPSGIGAVYAFDDTVLTGWKGFDAHVQRMMTAIGAW